MRICDKVCVWQMQCSLRLTGFIYIYSHNLCHKHIVVSSSNTCFTLHSILTGLQLRSFNLNWGCCCKDAYLQICQRPRFLLHNVNQWLASFLVVRLITNSPVSYVMAVRSFVQISKPSPDQSIQFHSCNRNIRLLSFSLKQLTITAGTARIAYCQPPCLPAFLVVLYLHSCVKCLPTWWYPSSIIAAMICCQPIAVFPNNLICAVLKDTFSIGNFHSCTDINILICIGQPAQPFFLNKWLILCLTTAHLIYQTILLLLHHHQPEPSGCLHLSMQQMLL